MTDDETPLRCKYALIIAAFRDLGELVKKQQASISELEAAWQQEHTKRADLIVDLQRMTNRAEQAEAALAERDRMLMTLFMKERDEQVDRGQDFFMPSDIWLADLKARAEEGRE